MNILEMCIKARARHGATQRDVAKATHYTQSVISDFENGKNDNYHILIYYIQHFFNYDECVKLITERLTINDIK